MIGMKNILILNKISPNKTTHSKITLSSVLTTLHQKSVVHILLILLLGLLVYSNTFYVPFQWDEEKSIIKNPFLKDFSHFFNLSKAQGHELYESLKTRYIGYLTFALNYKINGFNVLGYHIVNITIHLLNALLVYLLVILTFKTPFLKESGLSKHSKYIGLFSSLLFVGHPIQTEAVTYIIQRLASLVTFFYLLSIVSYITSRLSSRNRTKYFFYGLSLCSALLAMKTKQNAFTLPLAITFYEILFFKGTKRGNIFYLIPILLMLSIIPLSVLHIDKPLGEIIGQNISKIGDQRIPRLYYFLTQFRIIVTYLRLLILPINQNLYYDYQLFNSFFNPHVLLSFLFLLLIFCIAIYLLNYSRTGKPEFRLIGFGILWFFLALSIESSLIPILLLINEYRAYLPSVGFFISIVTCFFQFAETFEDRKIRRIAVSILIGIILLFSYATFMRNALWRDKISLWSDVIKKSPNKTNAYINRGVAFIEKGLYENAIDDFKMALSINPNHVLAHHNLGVVYLKQNKFDDAMREAQSTLKLFPDLTEGHLLHGMILGKKGKFDEAISEFQVATKLSSKIGDVNNPDFHNELASFYFYKGRLDDAMKELQMALKLKPDFIKAHKNLAVIYIKKNRFDEGIRELKMVIKLKPDFAESYNDLGAFYLDRGRLNDAMKELQMAINLKPDLPEAHKNLATIYTRWNRFEDAVRELQIAIRLKPDFAEAYNDIGYVFTLQGKIDDAVEQFQNAVRLAPGNSEYMSNLQKTNLLKKKQ